MNSRLHELFPRGSKSFYEANPDSPVQNAEPVKQPTTLEGKSKGKAPSSRRPIIGFTLFRVKLLDWEAKYSSIKDLLDGLRYAGLIHGDREDEIDPKSYVRQKKVKSFKEEKTMIDIETPERESDLS